MASSSSLQLLFIVPHVISPIPGEVDGLQLALETHSSSLQVGLGLQQGRAVRFIPRENDRGPLEPELYSFDALSFGRYP